MTEQTLTPYADAELSWRHVFIRDLKLTSPVENRRLRINLDLAVAESTDEIEDNLANVVCYEAMAASIRRLVETAPTILDEMLAEHIAAMSLRDVRVKRVRVRVETLEAVADTVSVGVEIVRVPR
jgi:7,8-dihydroneopterin aldolase/epimerase/oxygenase